MNSLTPPPTSRHSIVPLLRDFSIDVHPVEAGSISDFREHLGERTRVYVGFPPSSDPDSIIAAASKLQRQNMYAVPHIAARRVPDHGSLQYLVQGLVQDASVSRLLLLGGDPEPPVGPYTSSRDIIGTGIFKEYGIRQIDFAGHPDGHPSADQTTMDSALVDKIEWARRTGLESRVITQFLFDLDRLRDWYLDIRTERQLDATVRAGLPGVVTVAGLMKFARRCGVRNSFGLLRKYHRQAPVPGASSNPEASIAELEHLVTRYQMTSIESVHLYSFGNFIGTAAWAYAASKGQIDYEKA